MSVLNAISSSSESDSKIRSINSNVLNNRLIVHHRIISEVLGKLLWLSSAQHSTSQYTDLYLYKCRIFLQHFVGLTWQPRFPKHLWIMQTSQCLDRLIQS